MTARQLAVSALIKCRNSGAWSGNVLDNLIKREKAIDERDKNLAFNICMGVIQNSSLIDFYINAISSKPIEKLDTSVAEILRSGAYQLLFLDKIPDSAAVNESVELCSYFKCAKAKGFINAILRKLCNKDSLPDLGEKGTADYLALKYSHPKWLAEYLIGMYGYSFTEDFFAENNKKAPIDLKINILKTTKADFTKQLSDAEIEYCIPNVPEDCITISGGSVTALPGFNEGLFFVQDRAASMVAEIADIKPEMNILDCCAAPGGKTFASALKMKNKGSVTSCDIHEKKLKLISTSAERLGISIIQTKALDASKFNEQFADKFDIVIADVPCSGIGVIRKKPEIRDKSFDDISGLPKIQGNIINNVSKYVQIGGELIYSTCTVIREENTLIVEKFLQSHNNFVPVDFDYNGIKSENGMMTFWPNVHGTDGFFIAKLKRIK